MLMLAYAVLLQAQTIVVTPPKPNVVLRPNVETRVLALKKDVCTASIRYELILIPLDGEVATRSGKILFQADTKTACWVRVLPNVEEAPIPASFTVSCSWKNGVAFISAIGDTSLSPATLVLEWASSQAVPAKEGR